MQGHTDYVQGLADFAQVLLLSAQSDAPFGHARAHAHCTIWRSMSGSLFKLKWIDIGL